jgi:hypothetical protein
MVTAVRRAEYGDFGGAANIFSGLYKVDTYFIVLLNS